MAKRRKRRVKKKVKVIFLVFSIICLIIALLCFGSFLYFKNYDINKLEFSVDSYKDKTFKIKVSDYFGNLYCSVSKSRNNIKWKRFSGHTCKYTIGDFGKYDIYIKKGSDVRKLDNINKVFYSSLSTKKDKYYIAVGAKEKLKIKYVSIGTDVPLVSSDDNVVYIKDSTMVAKGKGKATVSLRKEKVSVVVTNLIDKMPKNYNYNRSYIPCKAFTEKEAHLLDEILESRVKDAGYKTRAGVVAAARFLTLEFPYRIPYFSENGRLGPPYSLVVDGEGRYYHKGLYLSEDKYSDINPSYKGPAMWGCSIYSKPSKGNRSNGLDCSGFTTWAVLNGGFDIGDLAAHAGNDAAENLNDHGKEVQLTQEVAMSDKIKAGDLLGEVTVSEGHSALVVGVDDDYYYVAEALWHSPLGVNINKYKKSEFHKYFETVNLMDKYYKKQGNYTAMWY